MNLTIKPTNPTIARGDTVVVVEGSNELRAWRGQHATVEHRCANGYDWVIDFNGSPVSVKRNEIRKV